MVKSIGLNKINTCVFISGTGSNLENLIKFSLTKKSPININLIFCNKVNAKGLMYANKYNIKNISIEYLHLTMQQKKNLINFLITFIPINKVFNANINIYSGLVTRLSF